MFSGFSYFSLAIRIFCFFAHFILLVLLLLIWIWAKKGWRHFPSFLLFIFSDLFCSLCFYSFHILRWDLLRLFGEANGRDTFFRILNYEKKTLYFLKIFFELLKRFLWTPLMYGFWCASKVHFFLLYFSCFFGFYWGIL